MIIKRNFRKASLILTADWHALELGNSPPCRTDDYMTAFADKMQQIVKLRNQHQCSIFNAGDIFDHWKPSPELLNFCYQHLPKYICSVAGNHDLPGHSMDLFDKSGYGSLAYSDTIDHLDEQISWNESFDAGDKGFNWHGKNVIMAHMLTWKDELPFPNCKAPGVDRVFDLFPDADLIITGDNHKTFTARRDDQLLINPGSLMRRRGDQVNHRPCVFLWYADTNTYQIHYLAIDKKAVTRQHLDDEKELRENKELFLGKLKTDWDSDFSFADKMERALAVNQLSKSISKFVHKWMGGLNDNK